MTNPRCVAASPFAAQRKSTSDELRMAIRRVRRSPGLHNILSSQSSNLSMVMPFRSSSSSVLEFCTLSTTRDISLALSLPATSAVQMTTFSSVTFESTSFQRTRRLLMMAARLIPTI